MGTYRIQKINENTFVIEEKSLMGQCLCYLLCGSRQALLIDSGTGCGGLEKTTRKLTELPVIVANTHGHVDHIGGNYEFAEIWCPRADRKIFSLHTNPEYTLSLLKGEIPEFLRNALKPMLRKRLRVRTEGNYHWFGEEKVFDLGERRVEVISAPGHTPGSVCFLDRDGRMLFSGDTVCEWGVLLHFPGEGCPADIYLDSLLRLEALSPYYDTIWPGHHGFPVDKDYLEEYISCARQIVEGTAAYGETKGRRCARWGRILITVPGEERKNG